MAKLLICTGTSAGQRLTLPPRELIIGRETSSDICLSSSLVSRRHCRLLPGSDEKTLVVEDLGSQNGTFVNDVAISMSTLLEPGDHLRIGATVFELLGVTKSSRNRTFDQSGRSFARPEQSDPPSDHEITDWLHGGNESDQPASPRAMQETAELGIEVVESIRRSLRDTSEVSSISMVPPSAPEDVSDSRGLPPNSWTEEAAAIIRQYWANQRTS